MDHTAFAEPDFADVTLQGRAQNAFDVPRLLEILGATAVIFGVVVGFQHLAGAYNAEFSSDDASHYVSGLLVHDYLHARVWGSTVQFVRFFDGHYPLVGIGHWPPFYYLVEAIWMLLFSPSRTAMLFLSASITVATSVLLYVSLYRPAGRAMAGFVALCFALSPLVQAGSSELMLDIPVAFFCLLAMLAYARYMREAHTAWSVLFGLLASAALLIKGNAACLALLPPLAVLIGRRFDLLRRPSFWIPVPIVGILAAPWYVLTYGQTAQGFRYAYGAGFTAMATVANSQILWQSLGPVILAAAAIGFLCVVLQHASRSNPFYVCAAALFAAVWIFQSIVPSGIQDRYLAPAIPPALVLAAFGVNALCYWLGRFLPGAATDNRLRALTVILIALSFLPYAWNIPGKTSYGFVAAAKQIWMQRITANPSILVASDRLGEASAIEELAMSDPARPSLFVVRGSRLLGGGGYNAADYVPRFRNAQEVMAQIDRFAIPLVLFRSGTTAGQWAHLRQIQQARVLYPNRWKLVSEIPNRAGNILLFRIRGNDTRAADVSELLKLSAPRALQR
jgi:hypothetical protein